MNVRPDDLKSKVLPLFVAAVLIGGSAYAHAINGAIFTTTADGQAVNANNYEDKAHVHLNGGPNNPPGCRGGELDDDEYYFQVTDPSGATLLSTDGIGERRFRVTGGEISAYLGSTHALGAASPCGSLAIALMPFADTPNEGGVYKVWITRVSDFHAACGAVADCGLNGFVPGHTKTDNFRVERPVDPTGRIEAFKFYDANANGAYDSGEPELPGWPMTLTSATQGVNSTHPTGADGTAGFGSLLPATDYFVAEGVPASSRWVHSTTIYSGHDGSPQNPGGQLAVQTGQTTTIAFGNYCTKACGGHTLGFWSNKNGQSLISTGELAALSSLNLRKATGEHFNPSEKAQLRSWLLDGNATNMAYMLSVQLAAMQLNVLAGQVNADSYYVPAGMRIHQIMGAANTALATADDSQPLVVLAGDPSRARMEQLKNWLDQLNNNAQVLVTNPVYCPAPFP